MYPTKLMFVPVNPAAVIAAVRPGAVWKLTSVSKMFGFAARIAVTYGVKLAGGFGVGMFDSAYTTVAPSSL